MLPTASISKQDGNTGVPLSSNPLGICAIIAPCQQGTVNTPAMGTKPQSISSTYGIGLLAEAAAYMLPNNGGKPVVLIRGAASTLGTFGAFTYTGTGTLAGSVTGDAASHPFDDFPLVVLFTVGGTTGIAGIKYKWSIDEKAISDPSKTWSAETALGVALTIAIPNTGITVDLVTAKTVVAQDSFAVQAIGPRMTDADVLTSLDALRRANLPWECVLVLGIDATATTVNNLDTWLAARETEGKYRFGVVNAALRTPATQTEAQYLTAQTTAWNATASIRVHVGADGSYITSPIQGVNMTRPTSLDFVTRLMKIDVTTDAARVSDGPLPSVSITDANGNPVFHNEAIDPGLDDQRLVTHRTFDGKQGAFICNPRVLATNGSDYVYAQDIRTINRACELAWGAMTNDLSQGVFTDRNTGKIREDSAQAIESGINNVIDTEFAKKVSYVQFTLSRDDLIAGNAGSTLTGTIALIMPAYVKQFSGNAKFIKTVAVPLAA